MTREMYERAVERMRELGEVEEKETFLSAPRERGRIARLRWEGKDASEALRLAREWAEVCVGFGAYLTINAFHSEKWGKHYSVDMHVSRSLSREEMGGCEKCAG